MSWTCFKVASIRRTPWEDSPGGGRVQRLEYLLPDGRWVAFADLPPGATWHTDEMPPRDDGSPAFKDPSRCVVLPGKHIWHMDRPGTNGHLWAVTGDVPDVTASPSINVGGLYHGFVRNGVVTDDVEGRRFDAAGNRIDRG